MGGYNTNIVNVCVVIAVAKPEGELYPLPGAPKVAKAIFDWAKAVGYRAKLVTDERSPVTAERLRRAIHPLISNKSEMLGRVVIAYAGHGVLRDIGQEFWLLSQWRTGAAEAVDVEKLKWRLRSYGPKQITIVSDACRTLVPKRGMSVTGTPIIDLSDNRSSVQIDLFLAADAGEAAYATPPSSPIQYSLLSQVFLKGLIGHYEEAVEERPTLGRCVTTTRLVEAVEKYLPIEASAYNVVQNPDLASGFRPPNDIYTQLTHFKVPASIRRIIASKVARPAGTQKGKRSTKPNPRQLYAKRVKESYKNEQRATRFESKTGLVIAGGKHKKICLPPWISSQQDSVVEGWLRFSKSPTDYEVPEPGSFLVQLANRTWVGAAVYPKFISTITVGENGAKSVIYRPAENSPYRMPHRGAEAVEIAIANMNAGLLSGAAALDFAASIREYKHSDPILGIIAAYVYAREDDINAIRQIAYFYASHGQPVPFDIAMLADIEIKQSKASYIAQIPKTQKRKPKSPQEERFSRYFFATPATRVTIAGGFPWLRQGWGMLEVYLNRWDHLIEFGAELRPAPFTTFLADAGQHVARQIEKGKL